MPAHFNTDQRHGSVIRPRGWMTVIDPYTIKSAIEVALKVKQALDMIELKRRVTHVENAVKLIDGKLDLALLIDLRAAFDHLAAARQATNEELRRDELSNARASFVRLTHRPATRSATVDGRQLTHTQIVAVGHLGNFHYFVLRDDPRQALAEAYLCAEKFPLLAIEIFPAGIFARDFPAALREISLQTATEQGLARKRLAGDRVAYREQRRNYLLEMAWKAPLAGGAIVAGLAAAVVAPSMAARGVQYAVGIMSGMGNEGVVPPMPPSLGFVDLTAPRTAALMDEVRADAAERRAALRLA